MDALSLTSDERKLIGDVRGQGFTFGFRNIGPNPFITSANSQQPAFSAAPFVLPFPCLLRSIFLSGNYYADTSNIRIVPLDKMILYLGDGQPPETNPGLDGPASYGSFAGTNWSNATALQVNGFISGRDLGHLGLIYKRLWPVLSIDFPFSVGEFSQIDVILRLDRA